MSLPFFRHSRIAAARTWPRPRPFTTAFLTTRSHGVSFHCPHGAPTLHTTLSGTTRQYDARMGAAAGFQQCRLDIDSLFWRRNSRDGGGIPRAA